eukprot:3274311-Rhodomonas_salina.1
MMPYIFYWCFRPSSSVSLGRTRVHCFIVRAPSLARAGGAHHVVVAWSSKLDKTFKSPPSNLTPSIATR